jgi:hypothetical protein
VIRRSLNLSFPVVGRELLFPIQFVRVETVVRVDRVEVAVRVVRVDRVAEPPHRAVVRAFFAESRLRPLVALLPSLRVAHASLAERTSVVASVEHVAADGRTLERVTVDAGND